MSSLRKYLKRKNYKERSQPANRKRLGLLEKHKDYVERSKHYHEQTSELERLKIEAEERNPNEFRFSMEHERTKRGIPISLEKKLSPEEELALKSKDLSFIYSRIRQETKEVNRLKSKLHLLGSKTKNEHVVFVEDSEAASKFEETVFFDTPKELLDRRFNRPRKSAMKTSVITPSIESKEISHGAVDLAQRYEELNEKLEILESLKALAQELWMKKELTKGEEHSKVTLPDGTVAIKWKRIRK